MAKINEEIINKVMEKVANFTGSEVKEICWQLFYDKETALKRLVDDTEANVDAKSLSIEILDRYRQNVDGEEIPLLFGRPEPVLANMNVDLGIKSPIVRDYLIEKCNAAVYGQRPLSDGIITKILKLFKTPENMDNHEPRVYGGLKQIGFSNEEAKWLYSTTNMYPFGILLERLLKERTKLYEQQEPEQTKRENDQADKDQITVQVVKTKPEPEQDQMTEQENDQAKPEQITDLVSGVLKHHNKIETLYSVLEEGENQENIKEKFQELAAEMQRLADIKELFEKLEAIGFSVDELIEKRNKIECLFSVINEFAA